MKRPKLRVYLVVCEDGVVMNPSEGFDRDAARWMATRADEDCPACNSAVPGYRHRVVAYRRESPDA